MSDLHEPIDLSGIKAYPLSLRKSKVSVERFADVWRPGGRFSDFLKSLPDILASADLRLVIERVVDAVSSGRNVILGMGAHVIKVGLGPVVIDLMERGVITGVAMNGAGIIHDLEVALAGRTSEDVAAGIGDGHFGMAQETAEFVNRSVAAAERDSDGLGRSVGKTIAAAGPPWEGSSILAAGYRLGIPVTVHIAVGTDIVHMHPGFDAAAAGAASHRDFRVFAGLVSALEGGVYLNLGSAVILPEVFLKAVTLVRNLGHPLKCFTTVNMDFIQHYRPMTNVVRRPTAGGGTGIHLTGHHEIMFPLMAAGILERLEETGGNG